MKNIAKKTVKLFFAFFLCAVILEVALRIYHPYLTRVKGDKIILPANKEYIFLNPGVDKLDKRIIHTKNKLGFRGENPPENLRKTLSIITVGGSSTECFYLSDDKTWPYLLEQMIGQDYGPIWLNNAGLDGHSTFGHLILLEDYLVKIKPKIIIFLSGANDVGRDDLSAYDRDHLRNQAKSWKDFLKEESELVSFLVNFYRTRAAKKQLGHSGMDVAAMPISHVSNEQMQAEIQRHRTKYIDSYSKRLSEIIDKCRINGIDPIFITQPCLLGEGVDAYTGIRLDQIKRGDYNGKTYWRILEQYNQVVKQAGTSKDVLVIDLANKLPKNSLYFYDNFHYSNEGAKEVAEIIYSELKAYLDTKYNKLMNQFDAGA